MAHEHEVEVASSDPNIRRDLLPPEVMNFPKLEERLIWCDKNPHNGIRFYYIEKKGKEINNNEDPYVVQEIPVYRILVQVG